MEAQPLVKYSSATLFPFIRILLVFLFVFIPQQWNLISQTNPKTDVEPVTVTSKSAADLFQRADTLYWMAQADRGNSKMIQLALELALQAEAALADSEDVTLEGLRSKVADLKRELQIRRDMFHDTLRGVFPGLYARAPGQPSMQEWFDDPSEAAIGHATVALEENILQNFTLIPQFNVIASPTTQTEAGSVASRTLLEEATYALNLSGRFYLINQTERDERIRQAQTSSNIDPIPLTTVFKERPLLILSEQSSVTDPWHLVNLKADLHLDQDDQVDFSLNHHGYAVDRRNELSEFVIFVALMTFLAWAPAVKKWSTHSLQLLGLTVGTTLPAFLAYQFQNFLPSQETLITQAIWTPVLFGSLLFTVPCLIIYYTFKSLKLLGAENYTGNFWFIISIISGTLIWSGWILIQQTTFVRLLISSGAVLVIWTQFAMQLAANDAKILAIRREKLQVSSLASCLMLVLGIAFYLPTANWFELRLNAATLLLGALLVSFAVLVAIQVKKSGATKIQWVPALAASAWSGIMILAQRTDVLVLMALGAGMAYILLWKNRQILPESNNSQTLPEFNKDQKYQELLEQIKRKHELFKDSPVPTGLTLSGPANNGKNALVQNSLEEIHNLGKGFVCYQIVAHGEMEPWAGLNQLPIKSLVRLISEKFEVALGIQSNSPMSQNQALREMKTWLKSECERHPLILWVENWEKLDAPTSNLLDDLFFINLSNSDVSLKNPAICLRSVNIFRRSFHSDIIQKTENGQDNEIKSTILKLERQNIKLRDFLFAIHWAYETKTEKEIREPNIQDKKQTKDDEPAFHYRRPLSAMADPHDRSVLELAEENWLIEDSTKSDGEYTIQKKTLDCIQKLEAAQRTHPSQEWIESRKRYIEHLVEIYETESAIFAIYRSVGLEELTINLLLNPKDNFHFLERFLSVESPQKYPELLFRRAWILFQIINDTEIKNQLEHEASSSQSESNIRNIFKISKMATMLGNIFLFDRMSDTKTKVVKINYEKSYNNWLRIMERAEKTLIDNHWKGETSSEMSILLHHWRKKESPEILKRYIPDIENITEEQLLKKQYEIALNSLVDSDPKKLNNTSCSLELLFLNLYSLYLYGSKNFKGDKNAADNGEDITQSVKHFSEDYFKKLTSFYIKIFPENIHDLRNPNEPAYARCYAVTRYSLFSITICQNKDRGVGFLNRHINRIHKALFGAEYDPKSEIDKKYEKYVGKMTFEEIHETLLSLEKNKNN